MSLNPAVVTAVTAMYNVADYLDAFFECLDAQTIAPWMMKVILVNDGSSDDTLDKARRWASATEYSVEIIDQENKGVAAARNAGFAHVKTSWVIFPDPDDEFADDYVARLLAAAVDGAYAKPDQVVARVTPFREVTRFTADGESTGVQGAPEKTFHSHVSDWRFSQAEGPAVVDMRENPAALQMFTHSVLLRTQALKDVSYGEAAPFDPRIKPTFEDAELIMRLLEQNPQIVLAPQARYFYRKRNDSSSLVSSAWLKPERYDDIFAYGYLPMLERARATELQDAARYLVHYELGWYDYHLHETACAALGDAELAETFTKFIAQAIERVGPVMTNAQWWHFTAERAEAWKTWASTPRDERETMRLPVGAVIPAGAGRDVLALPLDPRCFVEPFTPAPIEPPTPTLTYASVEPGVGRRCALRGQWVALAALVGGGNGRQAVARSVTKVFGKLKR